MRFQRAGVFPFGLKLDDQPYARFVVSVDAHSTRALHNLRFGVHTARRGWIRRGEVLNALSANSGITLAPGKSALFVPSGQRWMTRHTR